MLPYRIKKKSKIRSFKTGTIRENLTTNELHCEVVQSSRDGIRYNESKWSFLREPTAVVNEFVVHYSRLYTENGVYFLL